MVSKALKKSIAKGLTALTPWTPHIESWPAKSIVLGAPHTSNMDAVLMVIIMWLEGRSFNFLVKDEVMKYPVLKSLVRWLGGIPVNRRQSTGITSGIAQAVAEYETFTLCITPKGSRSKQEYWKSGFYRIALETGLPVQLGFIDRNTRTYGWAGTIELTGDVNKDMDRIRAFYDGKTGFHPDKTSIPRLRAEDDADARAWLLDGIDLPERQGE